MVFWRRSRWWAVVALTATLAALTAQPANGLESWLCDNTGNTGTTGDMIEYLRRINECKTETCVGRVFTDAGLQLVSGLKPGIDSLKEFVKLYYIHVIGVSARAAGQHARWWAVRMNQNWFINMAPLIGPAIEMYCADGMQQMICRGGGNFVGGSAGAAAGASGGALLGPVGAAVGGVIGAVAGAMAGAGSGEMLCSKVIELLENPSLQLEGQGLFSISWA